MFGLDDFLSNLDKIKERLYIFDFDGVLTDKEVLELFKVIRYNEDVFIISSRDYSIENINEVKDVSGIDEHRIMLCGGFMKKIYKVRDIQRNNTDKDIIYLDDDPAIKTFFDNFKDYHNLTVITVHNEEE